MQNEHCTSAAGWGNILSERVANSLPRRRCAVSWSLL